MEPNDLLNFQAELEAESSILAVSSASMPVFNVKSFTDNGYDWPGKDPDFQLRVGQLSADSHFQEVFGIQLMDGRWFNEQNLSDNNAVILNEQALKELQIDDPIGKAFEFQGQKGQIIGIAKDFHFKSIHIYYLYDNVITMNLKGQFLV